MCIRDSPVGPIYGWFSKRGLCWLRLPVPGRTALRVPVLHSSVNDQRVAALRAALDRYFSGIRQDFEEIPLDLGAATPFRLRVWQALRDEIPWGSVMTYGALAERLGCSRAAQAAGQALKANPIPILIPCHRIVASNGQLGGYSCGPFWKRELLRVEGSLTQTILRVKARCATMRDDV